ncbi:uncharacterized protein LOC123899673 [Trifolium pratense]|uniref:uncharacterized protein LOC123899673 n=1 Tax=Trifolium pratense TaxID=57577 RepID=UPI001E696561|nr:uncharacterized protein LOC123899673 [Trifolium pratense]
MQVSNIRGCHLTAGFYKLNVDSAGPSGQGKWGLATVIQDADGLVSAVGCWCLPILPYSNVAEAFEKAGSDNSNMIAALTNKQQVSAYWNTIVEDCIKLTFSLNSVSFTNVRRVANQTIHYLAKLDLSSSLGFIWIEETTSCIFEVVAFDLPPESVQ